MAIDPFAKAAAPQEKVTEEEKVEEKSVNIDSDQTGITITLKGGSGYDAPWIVVRANNVWEAVDVFSGDTALVMQELQERVHAAASTFIDAGPKKLAPARPAAQSVDEPANPSKPKPGDDWTYKTGVSKTGKPWKAWMPPKGSDESPVWL